MRDVIHSCGESWLVVDFGHCSATELFSIYQEFGLLCARGHPRRVLLKTGNEDADVHYTLRDVLLTVACVVDSLPLGMRLALVASSIPVAQVGRAMRQELSILGCELRVFGSESKAALWLGGGISRRRAPATAGACA